MVVWRESAGPWINTCRRCKLHWLCIDRSAWASWCGAKECWTREDVQWSLTCSLRPYLGFFCSHLHVPYSTYYKPMGDLPYISSEQGGLIIHTELIYELPRTSVLYLYKNFELKRGWAYNTSWAYNTYYTVHVIDLSESRSQVADKKSDNHIHASLRCLLQSQGST